MRLATIKIARVIYDKILPVRTMDVIHEDDSASGAVCISGAARLRRALISIHWRSGLDGVSPHPVFAFPTQPRRHRRGKVVKKISHRFMRGSWHHDQFASR